MVGFDIDISDLIGVPFRRGGRDINTGFDCWGLAVEVYKRYGITIPEYNHEDINALSNKDVGETILAHLGEWVELPQPEIPCIVTVRNDIVYVNHVGVYIGNNFYINTLKKMGTCLIPLTHPYWSKRIHGFYQY